MFHDEDALPSDIRQAIIDRFDAWDLVDLLGISTEKIVDAFEDIVVENLDGVLDYGNIRVGDDNED